MTDEGATMGCGDATMHPGGRDRRVASSSPPIRIHLPVPTLPATLSVGAPNIQNFHRRWNTRVFTTGEALGFFALF